MASPTATVNASQAAPGAFVVVASTGNVYRLGPLQSGSTTTFYLQPGFDAASASETGGPGFIVGAASTPTETPSAEPRTSDSFPASFHSTNRI